MTTKKTAGVIAPPPLIFATLYLVGYGLQKIYPSDLLYSDIARYVGWLPIAGAFALAIWAIRVMRKADTSENPFKETTALVTDGPYKVTRNPMYVSLTLLYIGVALVLRMVWPLATLPIAILILHHGVILREEKYLEQLFADKYREYLTKAPRWL